MRWQSVFEWRGLCLVDGAPADRLAAALALVAAAQSAACVVAFIDTQHTLDMTYVRSAGADPAKLLISQPDTVEQAFEIADALVRSGAVDLVVLDEPLSLTALRTLRAGAQQRRTCVAVLGAAENPTGLALGGDYAMLTVTPAERPVGTYHLVFQVRVEAQVRLTLPAPTIVRGYRTPDGGFVAHSEPFADGDYTSWTWGAQVNGVFHAAEELERTDTATPGSQVERGWMDPRGVFYLNGTEPDCRDSDEGLIPAVRVNGVTMPLAEYGEHDS